MPFADGHFDVAAMALVIFFVPDPARGVAEMRRVVRPTGTVCAYAWDMPGGGFPFEVIMQELAAAGIKPPRPPRAEVSALGALEALWHESGLEQIRTRAISVTRTFVDFEEFWSSSLSGTAGQVIRALPSDVVKRVKDAVLAQMPSDSAGRVTRTGVANAVSGLVPG